LKPKAGERHLIMSETASSAPAAQQPEGSGLEGELAKLIVQGLNLPLEASQIDPEAPLYGAGLGLDSIDILEIALIVSKHYGVQLRADGEENQRIFRSLRHFAHFVAAQRTK
jgi:acyl carrier protein